MCGSGPQHWALALAGKDPEYIDDRVCRMSRTHKREDNS